MNRKLFIVTVEFPCAAAASNQARVCLRSVASNEPAIQLDGGYAGEARQVSKCGVDTPWVSFTPIWTTNAGTLPTVSTDQGWWRRVGDSMEIRIFRVYTGAGTGGGVHILTVPGGRTIDLSGSKMSTAVGGTGAQGQLGGGSWYDDTLSGTQAGISVTGYPHSSTQIGVIPNGSASTGVNTLFGNNDRLAAVFKVPIVGWEASQCVTPDAQGWFASGTITGANPSISSPTSSWRETTNASLTMVQNPGSATVGIPCASGTTNTFGALTCASANESIGIEVNAPRSGAYEVCAQGSVGIADSDGGANGLANFAFAPNLTSAGSSTVVTQSTHSANVLMSTGDLAQIQNVHYSFNVCSTFVLSAGRNTFRLMNEGSETGTIASIIVADGDAGAGNRGITFTVKPVTAQQQAILANSVSTDVTNGLKVTTTRFTTTTGPNACVVGGSIDNSWISGTPSSSGAGQCSFTMTGFSAQPDCQFTVRSSPAGISVSGNTSSATAGGFQIWDALGAATTGSVVVTCIGPR